MEKRVPVLTFLSGFIVGAGLLALLSFNYGSSSPNTPPRGVTQVDTTVAKASFSRYYSSAEVSPMAFKGFYIDTTQINALVDLRKLSSRLPGFRIYMGKNVSNAYVGIIVGVNSNGLDQVTGPIYLTNSPQTGPCPFVCDVASPIIRNK